MDHLKTEQYEFLNSSNCLQMCYLIAASHRYEKKKITFSVALAYHFNYSVFHVASGCCIEQYSYRTFSSSQKALLDSAGL